MRKVPRRRCYTVKNKNTKRVMAKCTSKAKATRQMRLLRGIKLNKKFRSTLRYTRRKK